MRQKTSKEFSIFSFLDFTSQKTISLVVLFSGCLVGERTRLVWLCCCCCPRRCAAKQLAGPESSTQSPVRRRLCWLGALVLVLSFSSAVVLLACVARRCCRSLSFFVVGGRRRRSLARRLRFVGRSVDLVQHTPTQSGHKPNHSGRSRLPVVRQVLLALARCTAGIALAQPRSARAAL